MENVQKLIHDPNLHIIFSITLIGIMGVSSITPAFPKISEALQISPERVTLLITVFTLPGIFLTPVLGVLADRLGRKKILVPSLFLFAIAGTTGFFSRNLNLLLICRFFQGMGAASLGSLNITLIGDLYSGICRNEAMGYNASVLSTGTASYPLIGGALASIAWYFPFLLPLLAIPVGLGVLFYLKNPEPKNNQHIFEYLKEAWQHIKNRQIIGLFLISTLTFIILYGVFLAYFPFLLHERFNAPPVLIGLIMSGASVSTAVMASQVGRLAKNYSERTMIFSGTLLYVLSIGMVPFMPGLWTMLIPGLLFGAGNGMNFPNVQTLLAGLAPMNQRAAIMSLNGTVLRLGQTLGPLIMAGTFAITGMNGVFFTGAGVAGVIFLLVILMINDSKNAPPK